MALAVALTVALAVAFDHSAVKKKQLKGYLKCFKVALLTGVQNRGGDICL
jgi:hypothetical protein